MNTPAPLPRHSFQAYSHTVQHWTMGSTRDQFELNPPYQRGSVWTIEQRRALIRSLIMGVPVGAIIYNVRPLEDEVYAAIVDGKQRVEALRAFVDDEFTVPSWWFEEHFVSGERGDHEIPYSSLSLPGQRFMYSRALPSLEARVTSIADEAAIFDLINTGGTAQEDADIARARDIAAGD